MDREDLSLQSRHRAGRGLRTPAPAMGGHELRSLHVEWDGVRAVRARIPRPWVFLVCIATLVSIEARVADAAEPTPQELNRARQRFEDARNAELAGNFEEA